MSLRLQLMPVLVTLLSTFNIFGADFTGTLTINGKTFPTPHVHAFLHDNAEGTLPSPTQLRILVTDREVPIESLYGLDFLPVVDMGHLGKLEGVLLQFDPTKPGEIDYTVLTLKGLQTVTTRISVKELHVGEKVSGGFDFSDNSFASDPDYPKVTFSFRIDAKIERPPAITADLRGADALNSPQVKALRLVADAIATGNFAALHKLTSQRATIRNKEQLARLGSEAKATYRELGADLRKLIPGVKRVVVRGDRAVVILPENGTFNLIFEGGSWKGD